MNFNTITILKYIYYVKKLQKLENRRINFIKIRHYIV